MAICRSCRNTKSQGFEGNTEVQRKKPIAFRNMHYVEIIHAECARYRCNPVDVRVQENAAGPIKGEYRDRKPALQLNFPIQLLRYFYPSFVIFRPSSHFFVISLFLSCCSCFIGSLSHNADKRLKIVSHKKVYGRKLIFRDGGGCSLVICKVRVRWERK